MIVCHVCLSFICLFRDKVKIQTEKALNGVKLGMVSCQRVSSFNSIALQAFVTFKSINHARAVLRDHKPSILDFK